MDEWDDNIVLGGEEDHLSSTLSHLLNPEEKTRRFVGPHEEKNNVPNISADEFEPHPPGSYLRFL